MDLNDLEKYCAEYSIRMTCRICNRPPSPKVELNLVAPSDGVYETIKFCGLTQITQENSEIFVCKTCQSIIYECALSLYHARTSCACQDTRYIICCICEGSIGVKEFVIDDNSEKYEALLRIVKGTVANPIWICKPCNDLLQDLSELYKMVTNTTMDNEPAPSTSKTPSVGDKKTPSKPINIPNPKPRARMWQSYEDSEDEDTEFKNNIFSDLLVPRSLMYTDGTNENVETKGKIPRTVASQNLSKWCVDDLDNEVGACTGTSNDPSSSKQPKTQQNNARDYEDDFSESDVIDEELANLLSLKAPFIMTDSINTCVGTPIDGPQSSDAPEGNVLSSDEDSDEPIYMRPARKVSDVDLHDDVQLLEPLALKQRKIIQETCEEVTSSNCDTASSDAIKDSEDEDVEFKNNIFSDLLVPRSLTYTDGTNENVETKRKIPRTVASQNLSKWCVDDLDNEVGACTRTSNDPSSSKQPKTQQNNIRDYDDNFSEPDVIDEELANLLNAPFIMADSINMCVGTPIDAPQSSDAPEGDVLSSDEDSDEPIYMRPARKTSDVDLHDDIQLLEPLSLKQRKIIQETCEEVTSSNCDTASSDAIKDSEDEDVEFKNNIFSDLLVPRSLTYTDGTNENVETKRKIPRTVASQNLSKWCVDDLDNEVGACTRTSNDPSSSKQPKTQQNNIRDYDDNFSEPDVIDEELANLLNAPFIMADSINMCVGTPIDAPQSSDAPEGDVLSSDEDSDEPIYMRPARKTSDVDLHDDIQLLEPLSLKQRKIIQETCEEVTSSNCDTASSAIKVTSKEHFNDGDAIGDGESSAHKGSTKVHSIENE